MAPYDSNSHGWNLPTVASDRVPITPAQYHQQLLSTVQICRMYIRLHRLMSPSHRLQVRRRHSALPHMSCPYSMIVAVLPPPRHTLQRPRSLIYHHMDIHRLVRGTCRHHHHSHQHPHAIRHSRCLSVLLSAIFPYEPLIQSSISATIPTPTLERLANLPSARCVLSAWPRSFVEWHRAFCAILTN